MSGNLKLKPSEEAACWRRNLLMFAAGFFIGALIVSAIGLGCRFLDEATAQQFYPSNPPGAPPTPQQQWNDQRTQQLFQQWMQQQLANGLHHDPC